MYVSPDRESVGADGAPASAAIGPATPASGPTAAFTTLGGQSEYLIGALVAVRTWQKLSACCCQCEGVADCWADDGSRNGVIVCEVCTHDRSTQIGLGVDEGVLRIEFMCAFIALVSCH